MTNKSISAFRPRRHWDLSATIAVSQLKVRREPREPIRSPEMYGWEGTETTTDPLLKYGNIISYRDMVKEKQVFPALSWFKNIYVLLNM